MRYGLFDRCRRMNLIEVDVIELQTLEACLHAVEDANSDAASSF
jgi:hypothetical protein